MYLPANWKPSENPGSGDILLFNVGNNNYLVATNNHTSANIANDLKVRDGNYTFLGDLQYNTFQTLDSESSRNTVIKKGDWTLTYGFRQAISADSYSVFTNASGKLDYSNEKYFRVGEGEGSTGIIENIEGDWTLKHDLHIGYGKGSRGEVYWRNGELTFTKTKIIYIGYGENSNAKVDIYGGNWTTTGDLILGNATGASGVLTLNGGTVTVNSGKWTKSYGGNGIINLNGGTLVTMRITNNKGSLAVNFNGGKLKANAADVSGLLSHHSGGEDLNVTVGAKGGTIDNGGFNVTVAATLGGNGGLSFTGSGTTTLNGAVNYSGKTAVTPGTTLAVANETAKNNILANGLVVAGVPTEGQTVMTSTADLTGADLSKVTCPLRPATVFAVGGDGKSIVVESVGEELDNYWTGAVDYDLSNGNNWKAGVVPTDNANIYVSDAVTLTKGESFSPASITFLPGASVTIVGSEQLTVSVISNLSAVVQTFACPVTFAEKYHVHCDIAAVNFSGEATAKYPDPNMTDNAASHVLMGNITFTNDWAQGKVAYPYIVPNGSVLHGKDARGTDATTTSGTNVKGDFLFIEEGGKAYFETAFVSHNKSLINTDGELHVKDVLKVGDDDSTANSHATHDENDIGVIYAGGLHKYAKKNVYIKVPALYIGSQGLGAKVKDYTIHFANDAKTVYATADFEIFGPTNNSTKSDWGLSLDKQVTFNTQGHTITWTGGANGSGALVKDGEGTLVFDPPGTGLSGAVTVKGGTLKVKSASGVSTGATTVKNGAMLAVDNGAKTGTGAVTVENGGTLAAAESGMATVGGNLTLKNNACLGFNYTTRNEPKLDLSGKTVTFEEGEATNVVVKITADEGKRGFSGKMVLTSSGGQFAGVKVSLAPDYPDWVKDVCVVDGEIVLDGKPIGTKITVR